MSLCEYLVILPVQTNYTMESISHVSGKLAVKKNDLVNVVVL